MFTKSWDITYPPKKWTYKVWHVLIISNILLQNGS